MSCLAPPKKSPLGAAARVGEGVLQRVVLRVAAAAHHEDERVERRLRVRGRCGLLARELGVQVQEVLVRRPATCVHSIDSRFALDSYLRYVSSPIWTWESSADSRGPWLSFRTLDRPRPDTSLHPLSKINETRLCGRTLAAGRRRAARTRAARLRSSRPTAAAPRPWPPATRLEVSLVFPRSLRESRIDAMSVKRPHEGS